jgi:hypothetical protein
MKKTQKLQAARKLADSTVKDSELYEYLNKEGYIWDTATKQWELVRQKAHDPTDLIKIRIWTNGERISALVHDFLIQMDSDFRLVERSNPYPCRPPKQNDSRVYLTFERR